MNFMVYTSGLLEQKMLDKWSRIPEEGRMVFRDWCRLETIAVLEKEYGVK